MRRLSLVGLAGVALGLTAEWVGFGWGDPRRWIPDLAVGWSLIGCGLVAWKQRPESRTGPLMAATGFTWFGLCWRIQVAGRAWVSRASREVQLPVVAAPVSQASRRMRLRAMAVRVCWRKVLGLPR
jgi:hypothetical protein